jgi:hypothetical protein
MVCAFMEGSVRLQFAATCDMAACGMAALSELASNRIEESKHIATGTRYLYSVDCCSFGAIPSSSASK